MSVTGIRRARFTMAFVLAAAAASAQTTASVRQATVGNAEEQVKSAQAQLLQAAKAGDKDAVSAIVADDVSWVDSTGATKNKEGMVAMLPAAVRAVDVNHVAVIGDTAVLTGVAHLNNGGDTRFLQEWVKRDGRWKLTAHEGTPVTAEGGKATGPMGATPPVATSGTNAAASEPRTVEPALSSDDERDVWKSQIDVVGAYDKGDVDAYSKLTSDDFVRIDTDGRFYTRAEWLDRVRKNAKQPLKPAALSDVQIRVDNDVARVTLQLVPFRADGTAEPPERQTRILAKRDGRWQQVAAVSTPLAQ